MVGMCVRAFECTLCQRHFEMMYGDLIILEELICDECRQELWQLEGNELRERVAQKLSKNALWLEERYGWHVDKGFEDRVVQSIAESKRHEANMAQLMQAMKRKGLATEPVKDGKDAHSRPRAVVQGNTEFALDLYQQLQAEKGNLLFSPYSISIALAMTYAGARGETELQMAQALHFPPAQEELHPAIALLEAKLGEIGAKGSIEIRTANALWPHVRYQFLDEFLKLTREYYGVATTPVDYGEPEAARQTINGWVEGKTEAKIKELIPPGILDPLTRLVLTNAIYFKGNWAHQFAKEMTEDAPFLVTPSETVRVPLMAQKHAFGYGETDDLQTVELPYTGNDLAMVVLLPKKADGLAELEAALTAENLGKWTDNLREREVRVLMPRFKVSQGIELKGILTSMGMADAFDANKANFSGMDGCEGSLYIAAALHKAFVEVNEEGTEAAAATAVVMGLRFAPPPPPTFRADHPFVFMIREKSTGSILFLGRVVNPI